MNTSVYDLNSLLKKILKMKYGQTILINYKNKKILLANLNPEVLKNE